MQRLLFLIAFLLCLPAIAQADIMIGVSAPLTGPAASVSEISLPGVKLAVADINAKGGVGGQKLRLEIMDDACDPKQAVSVAGKLTGMKGIAAVISDSCSNAVKSSMPIYQEEGLPLLASVASNPDLTQQNNDLFFRPGSRDDNDATVATGFIAAKFAGKRVAIIDDKSTWGSGMAALIDSGLKAKGVKGINHIQLNAGEQDYSAIVSRMKNERYDVVYPALMMREAGLLIRQMGDAGYRPAIVGSMTIAMPDVAAILGAAQEGLYFTRVGFTSEARALTERLGSGDEVTSIYNVQSYVAVQVLAQALEKVGSGKPIELGRALHAGPFQTVLGPIAFDKSGDISDMKFEVMQIQKSKEKSAKPYVPVAVWP